MRTKGVAVLIALVMTGLVPAGRATAQAAPTDVDVCGPVPAGYARCLSVMHGAAGSSGVSATATPVDGITPQQLKAAYRYPAGNTAGQGQTVAVVSAFHAPTLEHDLGVFSKQFGLASCTTKTGCLTVMSANGTTPEVDPGWALETTLDVEWVHAVAPGAKILVVESSSNAFVDLFRGENEARLRTKYVSNSWGGPEFDSETIFEPIFTADPQVSFFFGSGDDGAPGIYPSASPNVVSVGGTSLFLNPDGSFRAEAGWSESGGGCSQFETASPAQAASRGYSAVACGGQRAFPDVAAVADPGTGVAIYDSTPANGLSGWETAGGTSVATPIIAARAALTGAVVNQAFVYGQKTAAYRDITTGNNGFPCTPGYDLVTGNGTWIH